MASAFEDELEETIFGRLEITCHSVLRKHDVHDVFVSSVFLVHDPSSRLWCQGIRSTMMSDRQSYSCSEVTANLWASVWNSRPRHSTGLTLRRAGYFSSRIGGTCCPWKRRIITTWMGTRRRLSQSSGTPWPADRSGVTNEVLKLLQDGYYVGWISPTRRFSPTWT